MFKDYQTTREQAARIQKLTGVNAVAWLLVRRLVGCVQFQRMPNISLLPGERDIGLDDIVAATDRGIVIRNRGSWSIDHQRYNFQFSGQVFYEVRNGKIVGMLRDVAYQSNTPVFWNSMDMIGGTVVLLAGRLLQRRQRRAVADQLGEPRVRAGALPQRHDPQHEAERVSAQAAAGGGEWDLLSREQAKALADRVLSFAAPAKTRVNITSEWTGNTRFADASITTSGGITDTSRHGHDHDRAAPRVGLDQRARRCVAEADGRPGRARSRGCRPRIPS